MVRYELVNRNRIRRHLTSWHDGHISEIEQHGDAEHDGE